MLIPAFRPIALSILLVSSSGAIAQTIGFSNIPYTATKRVTSIQKLVDGTTITLVTTSTEARDSQGRTIEQHDATVPPRSIISTTVVDPVARTTTTWMSQSKFATRFHMPEPRPRGMPQTTGLTGMGSGSGPIGSVSGGVMGGVATGGVISIPPGAAANLAMIGAAASDPKLRPSTQNDKLGGKTIAGVYAEGVRVTITYPTGFFGNDRPIVNVRETWTAPDLRIVLLTTDDDPRYGLRTTEVTTLVRGEPDPALFQVPEGYTIKDQYPQQN